jgi:hypothetical protein
MIITILRKPLEGSVADNVLKHGCGALNIDATRITTSDNLNGGAYASSHQERHDGKKNWRYERGKAGDYEQPTGRWPANFILIGNYSISRLDEQSGHLKSGKPIGTKKAGTGYHGNFPGGEMTGFGDEGGASRFFKQFKKGNKQ